jgi:hypothetical protein
MDLVCIWRIAGTVLSSAAEVGDMSDQQQEQQKRCTKHCAHDVKFMTGDPMHATERQVWCTYEDEDGYCGHVCKEPEQ